METLRLILELVASLLLFLDFRRSLRVITLCRTHDLKYGNTLLRGAVSFTASALFILLINIDLSSRYPIQEWVPWPPSASEQALVSRQEPAAGESGAPAYEAVVTRVIDGDTVLLQNGERVIYIGADAPDAKPPGKRPEPLSREAYLLNKKLVEGKVVKLEFDNNRRDKYNRLRAYVYQGENLINNEMILSGLARVVQYYPLARHRYLLYASERQAMEEKRGIWRERAVKKR